MVRVLPLVRKLVKQVEERASQLVLVGCCRAWECDWHALPPRHPRKLVSACWNWVSGRIPVSIIRVLKRLVMWLKEESLMSFLGE